jgi:hypothetical protein
MLPTLTLELKLNTNVDGALLCPTAIEPKFTAGVCVVTDCARSGPDARVEKLMRIEQTTADCKSRRSMAQCLFSECSAEEDT